MSDDLINGGRIINGNVVWDNKMSAFTDEQIQLEADLYNLLNIEGLQETAEVVKELFEQNRSLKSERDSLAKDLEHQKAAKDAATRDYLAKDELVQTLERERDNLADQLRIRLKLMRALEQKLIDLGSNGDITKYLQPTQADKQEGK